MLQRTPSLTRARLWERLWPRLVFWYFPASQWHFSEFWCSVKSCSTILQSIAKWKNVILTTWRPIFVEHSELRIRPGRIFLFESKIFFRSTRIWPFSPTSQHDSQKSLARQWWRIENSSRLPYGLISMQPKVVNPLLFSEVPLYLGILSEEITKTLKQMAQQLEIIEPEEG